MKAEAMKRIIRAPFFAKMSKVRSANMKKGLSQRVMRPERKRVILPYFCQHSVFFCVISILKKLICSLFQ